MRVAIAGLGYVGLSLACLLSQHNEVVAVDIDASRVDAINRGVSPIEDPLVQASLSQPHTQFQASINGTDAYAESDIVIVATPTNYDDNTHSFDTSSIEDVLNIVEKANQTALVAIKSTVPVGYTKQISQDYPSLTILFSPEFLREGHALDDNLHPSRIIVGITQIRDQAEAEKFAHLLMQGAADEEIPMRIMGSTEAEAIKLFSNTYLALRVSFFNELDTYAEVRGLNSREIIEGVCLDPRIGTHYNNPSFGYGGYCLPKDSKQLLSNYEDVPQNLIRAIVDSNATRKEFIIRTILNRNPQTIGVFRLVMKSGSDDFRQSSTLDIIEGLRSSGANLIIYEPTISETTALGYPLCTDLEKFKSECDLILANRWSNSLCDVRDKVYTRDLWQRD